METTIYTILIPLLVISLFGKVGQYLSTKSRGDKGLWLIIITALQLIAVFVALGMVSGIYYNKFIFLTIVTFVVTNMLHYTFDTNQIDIRLSKLSSLLLNTIIQITLLIGFYFLFY